MSRARSQLIVVPVFTDVRSSGFPVTKRNVICSSHALRDFTVAAVAGFPLTVLPFTHRAASVKPVTDTDWEVLFAPYDRFTPNIIDPTAELQPGLPVLLAGYPHDQNPNATAADHASASPTYLDGVIKRVGTADSPDLIYVKVPWDCYHGMSGGPVAVVDSHGAVKVWGVIVGGIQLWKMSSTLIVARLRPDEIQAATSIQIEPPSD